ncbi:translation elongation factor Ts [Bogoriella caseilytica]|uniref:Elongation factor Ts n=1 Tax=Bogoriella caseilytica TaxID=56055 RepID=A0A3N2BFI2_9MICO|nr:translation elongation factor Ts [Bogoriella caseilytica]ROR74009.1 elongation factor Ts [Bogoriella caseilytica]
MANYTAADIKALREKTGAGMLDVKKALDEADGDQEKALEIIRVKGLKGVAKREGRTVGEGLVAAEVVSTDSGETGVLVEVNAETDFVVKNEQFIAFSEKVLAAAVSSGAEDVEALLSAPTEGGTVKDLLDNTAATLGEKIVINRIERVSGEKVATYLHRTAKDLPPSVGVLVATDAAGASVGRDVAMHVAAYSPNFLSRDEVPADVVANEERIAEETARNENKPEQALPKIVQGRVNGFYKENVLVDQPFAKEPKKTVGAVVSEAGGTITGFVRIRVGS